MVIDNVCVWFGMLLVIISVVLNLFIVCVNVSSRLVRMLCYVSGSVMWKNIVILDIFSVCVVCFNCLFIFLNVVCVGLNISGKEVIVVVIIVVC